VTLLGTTHVAAADRFRARIRSTTVEATSSALVGPTNTVAYRIRFVLVLPENRFVVHTSTNRELVEWLQPASNQPTQINILGRISANDLQSQSQSETAQNN